MSSRCARTIGWLRSERAWANLYCKKAAARAKRFSKQKLCRVLRRAAKRVCRNAKDEV
jgi:hypothetical protein